jgi:predicted glycogen debranching enzyme
VRFGRENWRTFERGVEKEWLLTNGIGGYASSTIIGANTRRYHGLLVASLNPPVERHLVLSKIDETLEIGNNKYNLYSFKTPDYVMEGFQYQQHFLSDPLPVYIYNIEDVFIEKVITMVYGENTVAIVYRIINGANNLKLRLTPLINFRDYHHNSNRSHMTFKTKKIPSGIEINPYNMEINITITCDRANFTLQQNCWFINMYYPKEQERGLYPLEDHFIPGYFDIEAYPDEEKYITIIATLENEIKERDGLILIKKEEERIKALIDTAGYSDEFAQKLTIAADKFIVYRKSTDSKTIIAGYPWFTDWGRDTMIALPGIALVTKRFDDAREILYTFSQYLKDGLIPNMFSDGGHSPAYNTVDASLWFFEAACKFINYTNDHYFIRKHIYRALKEIVNAYINGTQFHIKMDNDFLISAGNPSTQLTWMDAKAGGVPVTPRYGKVVEINALWYNALIVISNLAYSYGEDGTYFKKIAEKTKASFIQSFWNEDKQCLYDLIRLDFKDDRVRPNQILAISLTNAVIENEKAEKIVQKVWEELYTDFGLRSLSPKSDEYKGIYIGEQYTRDSAYHQGTAWAWLSGHFITAYIRVFGKKSLHDKRVQGFIEPFKDHIKDACIGSISEIFDGDKPYIPRGCISQAWSVGEILRAYVEDILGGL